jgi:hypothetical protein
MKNVLHLIRHILTAFTFFSVFISGTGKCFAQSSEAFRVNAATFGPSKDFIVTIDGKNALVYSSPVSASFSSFTLSKPVEIKIKSLTHDVKWVDLRPLSSGIKPVIPLPWQTIPMDRLRKTIEEENKTALYCSMNARISLWKE